MIRRIVAALAAGAAVLALALPQVSAQTVPADMDLAGGGHFYTQTNGGAGAQYGYRITNDGGIGFWSEFQRLGGVNALGYPVSTRFTLDGFTVQATQKVIMQWRPDTTPPQVYFVNVFDKLHDLGKDSVLQQTYQIPPQLDPSFDAGKTADQITAARLALLNADAAIAGRYNAAGALAVLYGGLPTSTITNEGPFLTLRAQRLAIQHWIVANPAAGIKPGDVTVVNGGDIAKSLGLVPAGAATPETAAGVPLIPAATATPVATPTPAFAYRVKEVTDPPVDCSSDPNISIMPCIAAAPNIGIQYIKGRVMDKNGGHLAGVTVQKCQDGSGCETFVSAGDGTFTFFIGPSGCPTDARTYRITVLDNNGAVASPERVINYTNCNVAGEFHFDFVRNS